MNKSADENKGAKPVMGIDFSTIKELIMGKGVEE